MIQYVYDKDIIIYTYAALGGLGLLIRFIVNLVYKHLAKASDNLGETKNKMLKHIKMKFETCFKLKIGVNNVDTFVDKNILKYRFCGLLLSTWENLCGQVLFLNLLAVPVLAVFGVFYQCGQDKILFAGAVGILSSAVLILVDKSMNLANKKKTLRLNLLDYLENFCKVRLEQQAVSPEFASQLRRELNQATEVSKQISAAMTAEDHKSESKDELSRRREARLKKEEERKLQSVKREEEQKKIEEARKEEDRRKQEEKKQAAARRREEERQKLEEEREALEARRAEMKKKALEKQQSNELKKQKGEETEQILHSLEEELKPSDDKADMDMLMKGLDEIASAKEQAIALKEEKEKLEKEKADSAKPHKAAGGKTKQMSLQEEKLIEDVLKEFFA
ncbi:MAG: hypothetical protein PHF63_06990 [Herbinix sp.]|nr:hypothetical protein [Herbinix sp.]